MALSSADRLQITKILDRNPSPVEITIFDTMWSEHCSYKSTKKILKKYLPTSGPGVVLGIGQDAGIVEFATVDKTAYCVAIAHESHNHPSQVLPIEGAATGVGGVVRDVYCMGADVIGVVNSLHFGIDDTNPMVNEIADGVVQGVGDYANPLGVPVIGGETIFSESYNENCLVNVAAIGIQPRDRIILSQVPKAAKTEPYVMVLVGKSTDSTGFGGASFSSATLDMDAQNVGATQVHDPFLKRVLVNAIHAVLDRVHQDGIEIGFKDLGAGGIACAVSELAASGGFGVDLELTAVNRSVPDLPAEVIAASETQERFCLAVPTTYAPIVLQIFNDDFALPQLYHQAGASIIGQVVETPEFTLRYEGNIVAKIPISAITTEVSVDRVVAHRTRISRNTSSRTPEWTELVDAMEKIMSTPNGRSKRYVYRNFDNAVLGNTVVYPGEADCGVIAPISGSPIGLVASMDSNLYGAVDSYQSGAQAVAEAVRNVISVGAIPLALTDCLNYGNPENPETMGDFIDGVRGIADAATGLGFGGNPLPIVSGNVSLYNESISGTVSMPSPVVMAIGRIDDSRKAITHAFKYPGSTIFILGGRYDEFGGTRIANHISGLSEIAPQFRVDTERTLNEVRIRISDWVLSSKDVAAGGVWNALCRMAIGDRKTGKIGISISIPENPLTTLFSENGGYVVEIGAENLPKFQEATKNIPVINLGVTTDDPRISVTHGVNTVSWTIAELGNRWQP